MKKQKGAAAKLRLRNGFTCLIAVATAITLCFPSVGVAANTETVDPSTPQERSDQVAQNVTVDLADGSVYLREQNGAKQYSRDSASWLQYEGTFTITGTTRSGAVVSVSGSHDVLLQNATIDETSNGKAAIRFENGSSKLIVEGNDKLAGGRFYPAVEVTSEAKLAIAGDGTLDAVGGDAASAIGCNGIDGVFGELSFEHTGTINATAGSEAPALGDSDQSSATGKVFFKSGTVCLSTNSFGTDIGASRIEAWGGSVSLSKKKPVVFTRGHLTHPFASPGGEATYLRISGLPEGFNLINARLYYRDSWAGLIFGSDASDWKTDYGVSGISPVKAGQDLGIFLLTSYYGFKDHMYIALAENNGDGQKYEGYLTKDETTGDYRVTLAPPKDVQVDPTIDVGTVGAYQNVLIGQHDGQKAYSTDSGANWWPYSGTLTLTGQESSYYYPNARVRVIEGNHDIRLFNLTLNCVSDTSGANESGPLNIEGTSSVNLTLVGKNSITEQVSSGSATINIHENAHLTIGGKGSLSVFNNTFGGAAIGSRLSGTGGTLTIAGGVINATVADDVSGAAIGSGEKGSLKAISITGGTINAQFNYDADSGWANAIGAGYGGSVGEITISGGTIVAKRIGATKTVITGGTINGVVQKSASSPASSARMLSNEPAEGAAYPDAVNEVGETVVPVTFSGLPANTLLSDMDFGMVNIDLVDDPTGGNDYGVRDVMTSDAGTLTFYLTNSEAYRRLVLVSCNGQMLQGMCDYASDSGGMRCALEPTDALLFYQGHTFEAGWLCEDANIPWATDGASSEAGDGSALTALQFESPVADLSVEYAVDNGAGFGESAADGDIAGSLDKPIRAIRVSLSGEAADSFSVRYRVYSPQAGWSPWMADGQEAGFDGNAVTAVQSMLVPAGQDDFESSGVDDPAPTDQSTSASGEASGLADTGDGNASAILLGLIVGALSFITLIVANRRRHGQD